MQMFLIHNIKNARQSLSKKLSFQDASTSTTYSIRQSISMSILLQLFLIYRALTARLQEKSLSLNEQKISRRSLKFKAKINFFLFFLLIQNNGKTFYYSVVYVVSFLLSISVENTKVFQLILSFFQFWLNIYIYWLIMKQIEWSLNFHIK